MNKKRYIPLVAIGALILSLIVVFPAFGAGEASFIDPGAINNDNDGSLKDSTPDEQTYGRQGGPIGLYLDDDSLDVPVRRVLIPELDASESLGMTAIKVHSDEIMADADTLTVNDYVMVGEENVRKVTKVVEPTAVPAATSSNWYIEVPAAGLTADDINRADATDTEFISFPNVEFTGFDDNETVSFDVSISAVPADAAVTLPIAGSIPLTGGAGSTVLTAPADATDAADADGNVEVSAGTASALAALTADATYTVTIEVSSTRAADADPGPSDDQSKTLTIHVFSPAKDTITLDRPFARNDMGLTVYEIDSAEILDDSDWDDDYGMYAKAIVIESDTTDDDVSLARTGVYRYRGDHLVAPSNIGDDGRLDGTESGRVSSNDALVLTLLWADQDTEDTDTTPTWGTAAVDLDTGTDGNQQHGIDDVDDEDVYFTFDAADTDQPDPLVVGSSTISYLLAWFEEPNDTGSTVTVRSQAYQTATTLVMIETEEDSGKFALQIQAVPFGTPTTNLNDDDPTNDDDPEKVITMRYKKAMVDATDDGTATGNSLPKFPVNERDTVTLNSSDSRATLTIETTPPTFTGLSPSHNFAGSETRPTVSAQVTDGDSGLDEKKINVLFWVDEVGNSPVPEMVNPEDDADVDKISGGFEISARLGDSDSDIDVVPDNDADIYWWVMATDEAGNVGFSDQAPTDDDGPDPCMAQRLGEVDHPTQTQLEDAGCQPYIIKLDSTNPKLIRAETGRHWNSALRTGESKDKTEYRVTKADASSVLVIFDEHLDATSINANDFEVNGATPEDASPYNVKVRDPANDDVTDYAKYDAGLDSVPDAPGAKLGYVFLRLSSDLKANAEPKVQLVGEVLDLAGNEQDTGTISEAADRIAPTLEVTIDEGSRPVTKDKVNLTITSDENIGSPTVEFVQVFSYDDKAKVTDDSDKGTGTVKFVSATEYTAVVSAGNAADGLYSVHVSATDAAGGNVGMTGDMAGPVDASSDTKAVLFEHDEGIGDPDVDPDEKGIQDDFETDDMNGYIRIDFSAEEYEYDKGPTTITITVPAPTNDDPDATEEVEVERDDLDTHHGVTIVSATLNGDDIADALQSNDAGNVFLYRAPDGLEIGEHKLEIIAEDAAGNRHTAAKTTTITITERKPFSLKLNPGWNLVSIPGEPADPDINVVIPADRTDITSVLAYDPTVPGLWLSASRGADGMFSGTLKNITATRGYWVETNTFAALKVMIPKQSPGQARVLPTIPVAKGWNMVPILDVDGDFNLHDETITGLSKDMLPTMITDANRDMYPGVRGYLDGLEGLRAYTFNTITNRWDLVEKVQVGKGYWVYVSKAGIIVP